MKTTIFLNLDMFRIYKIHDQNKIYNKVTKFIYTNTGMPVNIFMAHREEKWIESYTGSKPAFYTRYVDDIFAVFNSENEAQSFYHYFNEQHPNIKFTIENEADKKLSFLDVFIDVSADYTRTSIFRKKTFTGLLTNFHSFTSFSYKSGLIKCLIDRAYKINNLWMGFHNDLNNIKDILSKTSYPPHVVGKHVNNYLNHKHSTNSEATENNTENNTDIRYFKLPYIGKYSEQAQNKLNNMIKKYCKSVSVRLIFNSFKIGQVFSAKDALPASLKSNMIYKFKCAGCNACYIGETTRHLSSRNEEHLKKNKQSHIYQHLHQEVDCFNKSNRDCFSVLDTASTKFQLKLKEGMYIGWENPDLNNQVKYISSTLSV